MESGRPYNGFISNPFYKSYLNLTNNTLDVDAVIINTDNVYDSKAFSIAVR